MTIRQTMVGQGRTVQHRYAHILRRLSGVGAPKLEEGDAVVLDPRLILSG